MTTANDFYASGRGTKLICEENYPKEIASYLNSELAFLTGIATNFKVIFEVGCMHGRFLEWALYSNKYYVGIDIANPYIEKAISIAQKNNFDPKKYKFLCASASKIHKIANSVTFEDCSQKDILIFFPFNCFGNIKNIFSTISSLKMTKTDFFISTYKTDNFTNVVRHNYYYNCKYHMLEKKTSTEGVRFQSDEGLDTIAYDKHWLREQFANENLDLNIYNLGRIGIGYTSINHKPRRKE